MWIKSRFATWEAEGQVEERIQRALDEGERWRLGQRARDTKAGHNRGRLLATARRELRWLGGRARGWLASRVTTIWRNGRATDTVAYKPELARQSRGGKARAEGS
jgi:hypothetical protein